MLRVSLGLFMLAMASTERPLTVRLFDLAVALICFRHRVMRIYRWIMTRQCWLRERYGSPKLYLTGE